MHKERGRRMPVKIDKSQAKADRRDLYKMIGEDK